MECLDEKPGGGVGVDRADLAADTLQTMLASEHVSIQAYRKIRWGERLGVFLEAA